MAKDNIRKVLDKLKGEKVRGAKFRTVIALIINGKETLFEGECNGSIMQTKNGEEGFGYDPIFKPVGFKNSFAQMSIEQKNKISHRGIAVKKLIAFLK